MHIYKNNGSAYYTKFDNLNKILIVIELLLLNQLNKYNIVKYEMCSECIMLIL